MLALQVATGDFGPCAQPLSWFHGHVEILKRIRKAIPSDLGDIFLEQEIQGDVEKNRPDLVVINSSLEKAIIVDVTIPFEAEENSLQAARTAKETKYSALKAWLQTKYKGGDGCIYRGAELMGP